MNQRDSNFEKLLENTNIKNKIYVALIKDIVNEKERTDKAKRKIVLHWDVFIYFVRKRVVLK